MAANGLCIERALAVIAIGVKAMTVPFIAFGFFTALESETTVFGVGTVNAALGFVTLSGLSAVVLVHACGGTRRYGFC